MPPSLTITRESDPAPEDVRVVEDGLDAFNALHLGDVGWERLNLLLRGADRSVVGGLLGDFYCGWLFIRILWMGEAHRGGGHGAALMREAEAEAARRGCVGVWLDTFSFQAPGFYRKLGYEEFGRLDGYPPPHSRFYLRKLLEG